MKTLNQVLYIFTKKNKVHSLVCVVLILLGVLLEMLGIGLIIPILSTLTSENQNSFFDFKKVFYLLNFEKVPDKKNIILFFVIFLSIIYFLKTIFLHFLAWYQSKFINNLTAELKLRLFKKYIFQDYTFHLQRNSSKLIQNIVNEVDQMVNVFFLSFMTFISEIFVVIGISIILIVVEPYGFFASLILFGSISTLFILYTKKRAKNFGELRLKSETLSIKNLQQGIDGIKAIKLAGIENKFLNYFDFHVNKCASITAKMLILRMVPRYYLEFLAIMSLAGLIFYLLYLNYTFDKLVVLVGLFAAAAFKILPSINRILSSFVNMRYGLASIETIYNDIKLKSPPKNFSDISKKKMPLTSKINLNKISYLYPNTKEKIFDNLNLEIKANTTIGIIGRSGSGKSTLIDMIVGILNPNDGEVIIDNKNINKVKREWQNNIGYIPQSIYLLDDTIKKNITLSSDSTTINEKSFASAIKCSQSEDFINNLPQKTETFVGEFGVRLSGGQKQRVGIARAMYHDHDVLVFDEATSSLDEVTEKDIIKNINLMKRKKTIIICSHKKEILKACDKIYLVENKNIMEVSNNI
tara:strand:+ start:229 stop:1971 length:1743 start_codon:yes stop_codon:yes gene_type:complete